MEATAPVTTTPAAPRTNGHRVHTDSPRPRLSLVLRGMIDRIDELMGALADAVAEQTPIPDSSVGAAEAHSPSQTCGQNLYAILVALADGTEYEPSSAHRTGIARAQNNQPLAEAIERDHVALRRLWEMIVAEAELTPESDPEGLRRLTVRMHTLEDGYTQAMVAGYRGEQNRRLLGQDAYRDSVVDALLQRQVHSHWASWSAANHLQLPTTGPFVVIATELPAVGSIALPQMEAKLRSLDVYSVWRLLPDLQVGIVHIASAPHLKRTLDLVSRVCARRVRVGVSAQFDDLRECADALHFAKVAMTSPAGQSSPIVMFDGSLLATAAVSSPDLMIKSVRPLFAKFDDLSDDDRAALFETFQTWQETDGSIRATAELLACHPNTVRQRLRRIEKRTGRSLSRPRDIAELCLAFEVRHRLIQD
ncbi:hypothetical protein ABIA30_001366 [Mycobacterium sp. MAA66]